MRFTKQQIVNLLTANNCRRQVIDAVNVEERGEDEIIIFFDEKDEADVTDAAIRIDFTTTPTMVEIFANGHVVSLAFSDDPDKLTGALPHLIEGLESSQHHPLHIQPSHPFA